MRRSLLAMLPLLTFAATAPPAAAVVVQGQVSGIITGHSGTRWDTMLGLSNGAWAPTAYTLLYVYDTDLAISHVVGSGQESLGFGINDIGSVWIGLAFADRVVANSGGNARVSATYAAGGAERTVDTGAELEGLFDPLSVGVGMEFSISQNGPFIANQSLYNPVDMADEPASIRIMLSAGLSMTGTVTSAGVGPGMEVPHVVPEPGSIALFSLASGGLLMLHRRRRAKRQPTGTGFAMHPAIQGA